MQKKEVLLHLFLQKELTALLKKIQRGYNTNYLGKGKILNLFFLKESSLQSWIDKAIKIIEARPNIFNRLIDNIETNPKVANILKENSVDVNDFKNNINIIKNDPSLLKKEIDNVIETFGEQKLKLPIDEPPEPLGFSGQLGCFLVFFTVLLPILVMIGTMIATFTIITCLNIGGCLENILGGILEGALQGLTPPGY